MDKLETLGVRLFVWDWKKGENGERKDWEKGEDGSGVLIVVEEQRMKKIDFFQFFKRNLYIFLVGVDVMSDVRWEKHGNCS